MLKTRDPETERRLNMRCAALGLLLLLVLETAALLSVAAQDASGGGDSAQDEDEFLLDQHDVRQLVEDTAPLAEPVPERQLTTEGAPPPTTEAAPVPAPTPEPTPDPNIPPGMEDWELLAFRLEYADEFALIALMEWAYAWVARDRGHDDGVLRARDLPDFLHRTLNPAEEDIADDERALLRAAADRLREEQGLHRDDMPVHIGFLSRGSPARFVRQLAFDMHHQNHVRRLQAEDRDL